MKKKAILFSMAIAFAITAGKIFAGQQIVQHTAKAPAVLISYTWFQDEDYSLPTGSVSDVNTEINRLQNIYPFNVFTALPSGTLSPYVYGKYNYGSAIIYSDL